MKLHARPVRAGVAAALFVALAATSCSSDGDDSPEPDEPAAAQSTDAGSSFEIQTKATVARVAGKLSNGDRKRLTDSITKVVQTWFNAAYVAGEYPRSNFDDAFPGFTTGAEADARRDKNLMSNKKIGEQISDVTPTRSRLWIDVLAPHERAVGVTARFELGFRTEGDLARDVTVKGRLLMTRKPGSGWKIFGYHVAKTGQA